ncbi:TRAP transporter substrate-binding protein [Mailhella massiliensis]|uniref:TRAP transporter substrate-binding protein n=1 Tax=Mailhella massiliensis TaxID=1903261 RepID=A0A921AUR9_9BACT|nr:TRAP transporter substrate-binding protein [Mailhella massiliensis]HJD96172.1 TRAP transporter substrate-binding protein [Mailhella massiliensis]
MRKLSVVFLSMALCLAGMSFPGGVHAAEAEYVLSLNLPIPPIHNRWNHALKPWVEELEKRSDGRIKVEPYFAEALSKEADAFESVKTGVADMAEFSFDVAVGQFPFHERVFTTVSPGVSMEDPTDFVLAVQEAFPEVKKEFEGVKVLFTHAQTVGMLIGSKDPIRTLEDFKGKKINVLGDYQVAQKVGALGASVVSVPMADVFTSIQQGVIDAATVDYDLLVSRRLGDVIKHVTAVQTTCFVFCVMMNQDVYDNMPEDLRAVIDSVSGEYGRQVFTQFWNTLPYQSLDIWMEKMGGRLHVLTDEEYAEIDRRVAPVAAEWTEILDKAGYPGEAMNRKIHELQASYARPWRESRSMEIFTQGAGK